MAKDKKRDDEGKSSRKRTSAYGEDTPVKKEVVKEEVADAADKLPPFKIPEKAVTPKAPRAPVPAPAPAAPKQRVPLRVFMAASMVKPDQLAGFANHAKRLKMCPRSIAEWREAVQKFNRTPVK